MNNNKLISVVLPVYNGETFLEESVKSVLRQTYLNIELIIVNDCSTDNTAMILERFASQDDRIRIINNETNKKLPASLNVGFSHAKGEYCTWTSDDNVYKETALEEMYNFLEENEDYALVYTDMEYIDETGNVYGSNASKPQDLFIYNCIGACFLYRYECRSVVGDYDVSRFLVEDYDYWLRISKKYKIGHIGKKMYQYRNHSNSLTATRVNQINQQIVRLKLDNLDYILDKISNKEREIFLFELITYGYECNENIRCKILGTEESKKGLDWISKERSFDIQKKIILFGSGFIGRSALEYFGKDNVYAFVDNSEEKIGTFINNKEVISAERLKKIYSKYNVVIATDARKAFYIAQQLEGMKIPEYIVYCQVVGE